MFSITHRLDETAAAAADDDDDDDDNDVITVGFKSISPEWSPQFLGPESINASRHSLK